MPMHVGLGIETVHKLLESCPRLTGLGNLRTWRDIDYYKTDHPNYFRSDTSALGKLKRKAIDNNWDLDLDMENLDYLYKAECYP